MGVAGKLTPLSIAPREPNESVIRALRNWLVMAKTGDITGVIILGVSPAGGYTRSSGGDMSDADAVYMAEMTIAQATGSSMRREKPFSPDELTDDDE